MKEFGSTQVPDAAYQVSRSSAVQFWRRFLKIFTIYGHGGHLGHVTCTATSSLKDYVPPTHGGSTQSLVLTGPVTSEEMFENVDGRRTM